MLSIICEHYILFVESYVVGLLSCFHFAYVLNSTVINISVQIHVQVFAFTSVLCVIRSEIVYYSTFSLWGTVILPFTRLHHFRFHQQYIKVPFFHILAHMTSKCSKRNRKEMFQYANFPCISHDFFKILWSKQ